MSPWNAPTSTLPSRWSFEERFSAPDASTVPGWQVAHSCSDIVVSCGADDGGAPLQLRQASGGFDVANAVTLDALESMEQPRRDAALLPAHVLVDHLPRLSVSTDTARRFLQGQPVAAGARPDGTVAVFGGDALLGVADVTHGLAHPRRVVGAPGERGRCG